MNLGTLAAIGGENMESSKFGYPQWNFARASGIAMAEMHEAPCHGILVFFGNALEMTACIFTLVMRSAKLMLHFRQSSHNYADFH